MEKSLNLWISAEEGSKLLGIAYQSFLNKVNRYRKQLEVRKEKKPNGGYKVYVSYSSLVNMGWIKDEFDVIDVDKDKMLKVLKVIKLGGNLSKVAENLGVDTSTVYRTLQAIEKAKEKVNFGKGVKFDLEMLLYGISLYVRDRKIARVYKQVLKVAKELGYRVGSYEQFYRWIKRWERENPDVKTLGTYGDRMFQYIIERPILRDWTRYMPLEVVFGDCYQFDVMIIDWDGKIFRPWASMWMDARTRRILSYTIGYTPSSALVADSLAKLIKRFGVPNVIYIDNGKEYKARIFEGHKFIEQKVRFDIDAKLEKWAYENDIYMISTDRIRVEVSDMARGLIPVSRLDVIRAIPKNARAKLIERFFLNISNWCETLKGWTGHNRLECPEETTKRIKAAKKGKLYNGEVPLMHIGEFILKFEEFLNEYHNSKHKGLKDKTPLEVWSEYEKKGWKPRRIDERAVDVLLMKSEIRIVRQGMIRLFNNVYVGDCLYKVVGQEVVVKWDDLDYVVLDGKAVPKELLVFRANDLSFVGVAQIYMFGKVKDEIYKQRVRRKITREELKYLDEIRKRVEQEETSDLKEIYMEMVKSREKRNEYLKMKQDEEEIDPRIGVPRSMIRQISLDEFLRMYNLNNDEGSDIE